MVQGALRGAARLLCVAGLVVAAHSALPRIPGRTAAGKIVQGSAWRTRTESAADSEKVAAVDAASRPSSVNCSWRYFTQKLDHFNEVCDRLLALWKQFRSRCGCIGDNFNADLIANAGRRVRLRRGTRRSNSDTVSTRASPKVRRRLSFSTQATNRLSRNMVRHRPVLPNEPVVALPDQYSTWPRK